MSDDLTARAKESSEGFVIPDEWGDVVELEEGGGVFVGRYRGQDTGERNEPIYKFWDEDGEPRFMWNAYRLEQGMEREQPAIGDDVSIYRGENYETKYDDPGKPKGLAYGVASEKNDAPLPGAPSAEPPTTEPAGGEPATDDDIPF